MSPRTKHDTGDLAQNLAAAGCYLVLIVAWARIQFADQFGFNYEESVIFSAFGLGALLRLHSVWLAPVVVGIFLWVLGCLAFWDYLIAMESGVLTAGGFWISSGFPPNGAFMTACLGMSLSIMSRSRRRGIQTVLGVIAAGSVIAISVAAIAGYAFEVPRAYAWAGFAPLSQSGAVLFALAGVVSLLVGVSSEVRTRELKGVVSSASEAALDAVSDLVMVVDSSEEVILANDAVLRRFGAPKTTLSEMFDEPLVSKIRTVGFPACNEGEEWSGTGALKIKGGPPVTVRLRRQIDTDEGEVQYALIARDAQTPSAPVVATDNTLPFEFMMNRVPFAMWYADTAGTVLYVNKALSELVGESQSAIISGWPFAYCHPDEVSGLKATGLKRGKTRRRLKSGTGDYRWIEEHVSSVRDASGELRGFMGTIAICDAEVKADGRIKGFQFVVTELAKQEGAVFWIYDKSIEKIVSVSAGFEALFGISANELKASPEVWKSVLPITLDTSLDGAIDRHYVIRRDDGGEVNVRHRISTFKGSTGGSDSELRLHLVEPKNVDGSTTSAGHESVARELRLECEHLYNVLAGGMYEATIEMAQQSRSGDGSAGEQRTRTPLERLAGRLKDFREIASANRAEMPKIGASLLEVIDGLPGKELLPSNVSYSGDLRSIVPLSAERLEQLLVSIATYVHYRGGTSVPRDIKIVCREASGKTELLFDLGDLPLERSELSRAFLPGAGADPGGEKWYPSLSLARALTRKRDGRAWLVRTTGGGVHLKLTFCGLTTPHILGSGSQETSDL